MIPRLDREWWFISMCIRIFVLNSDWRWEIYCTRPETHTWLMNQSQFTGRSRGENSNNNKQKISIGRTVVRIRKKSRCSGPLSSKTILWLQLQLHTLFSSLIIFTLNTAHKLSLPLSLFYKNQITYILSFNINTFDSYLLPLYLQNCPQSWQITRSMATRTAQTVSTVSTA